MDFKIILKEVLKIKKELREQIEEALGCIADELTYDEPIFERMNAINSFVAFLPSDSVSEDLLFFFAVMGSFAERYELSSEVERVRITMLIETAYIRAILVYLDNPSITSVLNKRILEVAIMLSNKLPPGTFTEREISVLTSF